jgi:sulfate/thiosulfate transport system substrate-binding protein
MVDGLWRFRALLPLGGLRLRLARWAMLGLILSLSLVGCQGWGANSRNSIELTLASFSVMKTAYQQIIPKFEEKWWNEHQQRVSINQSYSSSGAQTRAIVDGLEADIAHLALGLDLNKIAKANLIDDGWEAEFPNGSIVAQSVVAIVTRPGNPKQIKQWADLGRSDVKVITADPRSSGVARWIFLALWNSVTQSGQSETAAQEFVQNLYRRVPVLARDAQEATSTFFRQGEGDVLLNYENEVLLAIARGVPLDYQIPPVNIAIETPIAILDRHVDRHGNREVVTAFVNYLFSPEAQAEFVKAGFRPQDGPPDPKFPAIPQLNHIQQFGGWNKVQKAFFADGAIFDQIYQKR